MAIGKRASQKGILLTLVTIVLVVLMLAEILTYVYFNINYETLDSFSNVANGATAMAELMNGTTSGFLHTSMTNALGVLIRYEGLKSRKSAYSINNTAYALESLMTNGTLYGANYMSMMGGATLVNYTNALVREASQQNFKLSLLNSSLYVYQESPYSINATYYTTLLVNSSSGLFTYPTASGAVGSVIDGTLINGSLDLYSVRNNNNYLVNTTPNYTSAVIVGNVYALYGSTAPFQFAYGTMIIENAAGTCSSIPSQFENRNFILVVENDGSLGSCGFGGVVTNTPYTTYNVPYLVYGTSTGANVFTYIYNGTSLLLNGPGLTLLNVSGMRGSIYDGAYFSSPYAPSYLNWAQSSVSRGSPDGLFSFNLYNRIVPEFSSQLGNAYLETNSLFPNSINHLSISAWFNSKSQINSGTVQTIAYEANSTGYLFKLGVWGTSIVLGDPGGKCKSLSSVPVNGMITPNTWHNVVAVFNTTGGNYIYLDGVQVASGMVKLCGSNMNFFIGTNSPGVAPFSGSISNMQIYNISLSPSQAARLYYSGIEEPSVAPRNLTSWWTLDGNTNDFSGNNYNASVINSNGQEADSISFQYIYGYTGDPVYEGSFYSGNLTNPIEGVLNCANINQCSNMSLQHLYLGSGGLSSYLFGRNALSISEANTFGLSNAVIPDVASFNGNSFIEDINPESWLGNLNSAPFSISIWVYPTTGNGVVVDETGGGTHDSTIDLSNGNAYVGIWQGSSLYCVNLGAVPTNSWSNIAMTYDGSSTLTGYINGAFANSASGQSRTAPGSINTYYPVGISDAHDCAAGGGVGFTGDMADYQIYNTQLSATAVGNLYLNNSVSGTSPVDSWPLSAGYNGLMNQTFNSANVLNPAELESSLNNLGVCTNANVIKGFCGAGFSVP